MTVPTHYSHRSGWGKEGKDLEWVYDSTLYLQHRSRNRGNEKVQKGSITVHAHSSHRGKEGQDVR